MQGLRSVGCPAHPSSCCELHSGLCSPQIRRNVLPVCFAPRKKSNIFSVYIESGKTCTAQVLKETAGLLRCPMGPGQSCYKKYQCQFCFNYQKVKQFFSRESLVLLIRSGTNFSPKYSKSWMFCQVSAVQDNMLEISLLKGQGVSRRGVRAAQQCTGRSCRAPRHLQGY